MQQVKVSTYISFFRNETPFRKAAEVMICIKHVKRHMYTKCSARRI